MAVRVFKKGIHIVRQNKNNFFKTQKGWKHGLVLFGPVCKRNTSGIRRWKAKFVCGRRGTIGICRTDVDVTTYVNQTACGWGYYQPNGKIGHAGPAVQEYGEKFHFENVVLEVELDCDAQTIGFYVNGKFQGIAFRNIFDNLGSNGLCGAISLYNTGDHVEMLGTARGSASAADNAYASSSPTHSRKSLKSERRSRKSLKNMGPRRSVSGAVQVAVEVYKKHADVISKATPAGLSVTKQRKGWNNGLILVGGTQQRHWNFLIKSGNKLTCGVCTGDVELDSYVNKTDKGWGLYTLYGTTGTAGPAKSPCCNPVKLGDVVNVSLVPMKGKPSYLTMQFAVNGSRPVHAFELPNNKIYYGAVSLYGADDHVVITTGNPTCKPQSVSSARTMSGRRSVPRPKDSGLSAVTDSSGSRKSVALSLAGSRKSVALNRAGSRQSVNRAGSLVPPSLFKNDSAIMEMSSSSVVYSAPGIEFTDGVIMKTAKGWDDGLIIFGPPARQGLLYGKFEVIKGVRTAIGVCQSDVDRMGYLNKTKKGWGYYQATGRVGTGGPAQTSYGERFRDPGTIVEVEVDTMRGTVQFWCDGKDQGYAFGHPGGPEKEILPRLPFNKVYMIAVSLYEEGASLKYLGAKRDRFGSASSLLELEISETFSPPPLPDLDDKSEEPAEEELASHEVDEESDEEEVVDNENIESEEGDLMIDFWDEDGFGGTYFDHIQLVAWLKDHCSIPPTMADALGTQLESEGFDSILALMTLNKQDLVEMNLHQSYAQKLLGALADISRFSDCKLKTAATEVLCEIGTFHNPGMPVMQIHIKKSDGTSFAVEAAISDTVLQLKQRVSSCEHVPLEKMQLIYAGRYLENQDTLEEHAVENDSNIYLVVVDNNSN